MLTHPIPPCITIGILAHVDAGKTSLTERLLFQTGAIDALGEVDAGDTQTDTGSIERRRGITIRTGVAAFHLGDLQVIVVDTPGHAEFVAEVERALSVLDAAILVVSAVEGIQSHTRLLMRTLTSMALPTVLFVNKLDRGNARSDGLVDDIRSRLAPGVLPVNIAHAVGSSAASTTSLLGSARLRDAALQQLAMHDDALLHQLVDGQARPSAHEVDQLLRHQIRAAQVQPLVFGSARTGAGVEDLLAVVTDLMPRADRAADAALHGRVFAFDRSAGNRRAGNRTPARPLVRLTAGRLQARDHVTVVQPGEDVESTERRVRVTALRVAGSTTSVAYGGDIVAITGLGQVRVGDHVEADQSERHSADGDHDGSAARTVVSTAGRLPRPDLQTIVTATDPDDTTALFHALTELAAGDPLIDAEFIGDGRAQVLLFGEVQQEVLRETLAGEYGIEAEFAPAQLRHVERPIGTGAATRNGYPLGMAAVVGLAVEPAPAGTGLDYRVDVELGTLPGGFHLAIRHIVRQALRQGLAGWPVADIRVRLIETAYDSISSTAGDFRRLTPLPLFEALRQAGTRVYEPLHRFDLEIPPDCVGPVLGALSRHEAAVEVSQPAGDRWQVRGELPLRCIPAMRHVLPGLTRGEDTWLATPGGDRLVTAPAAVPTAARTDGNPLDEVAYLRYLRGW